MPMMNFYLNPYLTNGFSHHYQMDESTFILGVLVVILGVVSGAILFAYVP